MNGLCLIVFLHFIDETFDANKNKSLVAEMKMEPTFIEQLRYSDSEEYKSMTNQLIKAVSVYC